MYRYGRTVTVGGSDGPCVIIILYPAGQLARFLTNPGPSHYKAALRVLVYLRDHGKRDLVLAPDVSRG